MKVCDDAAGVPPYVVATFVPPVTLCNGEEYDQRFGIVSDVGNVPPQQFNTQYVAKRSSRGAKVDGIDGTRETFQYLTDSGFAPPKSTILVLYVFMTACRTYRV